MTLYLCAFLISLHLLFPLTRYVLLPPLQLRLLHVWTSECFTWHFWLLLVSQFHGDRKGLMLSPGSHVSWNPRPGHRERATRGQDSRRRHSSLPVDSLLLLLNSVKSVSVGCSCTARCFYFRIGTNTYTVFSVCDKRSLWRISTLSVENTKEEIRNSLHLPFPSFTIFYCYCLVPKHFGLFIAYFF